MKQKNKNATRALMGIDELTGHSITTPMGEPVFYIIQIRKGKVRFFLASPNTL